MTNEHFFHSGYARKPNDHYPTIDTRLIDGLLHHFPLYGEHICDPCSPNGSAIVDYLNIMDRNAYGLEDAFSELKYPTTWIVTNTPYTVPLVDQLVEHFVSQFNTRGDLEGVACLFKTAWDHASSRDRFTDLCPRYYGQIKLRFRPWWTDEREHNPQHSYVWHIWTRGRHRAKRTLYYTPPYDPKYASRKKRKEISE